MSNCKDEERRDTNNSADDSDNAYNDIDFIPVSTMV